VKTGDRINIGKSDLDFCGATMLHWPDSMFTYLTGKNILMPNDAFGSTTATAFPFNDQVNRKNSTKRRSNNYATSSPLQQLRNQEDRRSVGLNLPVEMIAPSHGVIWRKDPLQIVKKYQEWAAQVPEKTAVVLYDTMWEGTRRMAEAIGDGLPKKTYPTKFSTWRFQTGMMLSRKFSKQGVIIGSPTLNQGHPATVARSSRTFGG